MVRVSGPEYNAPETSSKVQWIPVQKEGYDKGIVVVTWTVYILL